MRKQNKLQKKFLEELEAGGKIPMFEILTKDSHGEIEWLCVNIEVRALSMRASHGFGKGYSSVPLDGVFSLDEHLQELYSKVMEDLICFGLEIMEG